MHTFEWRGKFQLIGTNENNRCRALKKGEESISAKHVLLGDIGATNARFALLEHGTVRSLTSFDIAGYAQFADVVTAFLQGHEHKEIPKAVFAVAGPVQAPVAYSRTVPG